VDEFGVWAGELRMDNMKAQGLRGIRIFDKRISAMIPCMKDDDRMKERKND
jgi:hypothetical protein